MHMGNELLTLPVAGGMGAAAAAGVAFASFRARNDLDERRVPLLGVLGAFVFAAQMVNFPVLPGTSGHFVGGALLAIVLGPHAAALAMAAIVIVQCFVFQDGGILALGANVFNMAVAGPYVAYGVFRLIAPAREKGAHGRASSPHPERSGRRHPTSGRARLYAASFLAAMASILAGAVLVPLEVAAAGVSRAPLGVFLGVMAGVHALIGAVEGVVTFAVLVALARMRPAAVPGLGGEGGWPVKTVAATALLAALLVGGFLSLAASASPDGLEWTVIQKRVVAEDAGSPAAEAADRAGTFDKLSARVLSASKGAGEATAIFPDYNRPVERWYWTSVSGVLGSLLVLGLAAATGRALRRRHALPGTPPCFAKATKGGVLRSSPERSRTPPS